MSDEFDKAFDQLVLGESSVTEEVKDEVADSADQPVDQATDHVDDQSTEQEVGQTQDAHDQGASQAKDVSKPDDDLAARLAALEERANEKPAVTDSKEQSEPAALPQYYTPAEEATLKAYEADWPDVSQAEALKRRVEYQLLTEYIFRQIGQVYGPMLQAAEEAQRKAVLGPEFEQSQSEISAWIDKQPSYLQTAYKQVIQSGSSEDIADLVSRFKRDAKPAVVKAVTELPAPTKQAVAALAPVSSKRSVVPAEEDKNDFDSAFDRFAKS